MFLLQVFTIPPQWWQSATNQTFAIYYLLVSISFTRPQSLPHPRSFPFPFLFGPGSISQTQHWSRSRQLPQWHSSGLGASTLASERRYSCIMILKKLKRLSKPIGHHCLQNITGSGQKNALGLARLVAHIACLGLVKIAIISDYSQAPEPNKASWPMAFIKHDLSNFVPHKTATYILLLALASNV